MSTSTPYWLAENSRRVRAGLELIDPPAQLVDDEGQPIDVDGDPVAQPAES